MDEKKSERMAFRVSPSLKEKFEEVGAKYAKSAGTLFEFLAEAIIEAEEGSTDIVWPPKFTKKTTPDLPEPLSVAEEPPQYRYTPRKTYSEEEVLQVVREALGKINHTKGPE